MPGLFQLDQRRRVPEVMDDPQLDRGRHHHALQGLARINRFGNSARLIWPFVRQLSQQLNRPVRILDIATGGGDVPLALWQIAARRHVPLEIAGCDRSEVAIQHAKQAAEAKRAPLTFFPLDALAQPLPPGYDMLMCSLFLHHLPRDEAVSLLSRMAAASEHLMLASDLVRSRATMLMTYVASRLLTRSDVVHVDGPLSVQAAFDLSEARQLAQDAGLLNAVVRSAFPARFILSWWRNA